MNTVRDEIPDTEQGLNLYYAYCKKQIVDNRNHIKRLETRLNWCQDKAKLLGIQIRGEEIETPKNP